MVNAWVSVDNVVTNSVLLSMQNGIMRCSEVKILISVV